MTDEFDDLIEEDPPDPEFAQEVVRGEPLPDLLTEEERALVENLNSRPASVPEEPPVSRDRGLSQITLSDESLPSLVTAKSLMSEEVDEGDFEPGGRYKGFEILPPSDWPAVKAHAHIQRRFYVRHNDTVGMVPWAGSVIIWPWERGWDADLHRSSVQSFLKEERKEKKRG